MFVWPEISLQGPVILVPLCHCNVADGDPFESEAVNVAVPPTQISGLLTLAEIVASGFTVTDVGVLAGVAQPFTGSTTITR